MSSDALKCPTCAARSESAAHLADLRSWFREPRLEALVELRVAQIYSCAACKAEHRNQAEESGETAVRLDALSHWRELAEFDAKERAALAWAEAVTLSAQTEVPEAIYEVLNLHFAKDDVDQLRASVAGLRG